MIIIVFLSWTLMLYLIHRLVHIVPGYIHICHMDHHKQVIQNSIKGLHWSNLLLWNDTFKSTLDLWFTEVIPTLIFCYIFNCWWLFVVYYIWAAFVQEAIEHNPNFNVPFITSGKWHLIHHSDARVNFGLFTSIWDRIFGTYCPLTTEPPSDMIIK
jgi:sterol desaturase/sphingolipid hydroxylase (fatty acid hydroxylase superfamily)